MAKFTMQRANKAAKSLDCPDPDYPVMKCLTDGNKAVCLCFPGPGSQLSANMPPHIDPSGKKAGLKFNTVRAGNPSVVTKSVNAPTQVSSTSSFGRHGGGWGRRRHRGFRFPVIVQQPFFYPGYPYGYPYGYNPYAWPYGYNPNYPFVRPSPLGPIYY